MMYSNRFVCTVKVNGKILREQSNLITLPFGAEYEILLKNLNSRRAMVKVSVDGKDATEGTRLILQPNASITLERFIRNNNLQSGNKFKFIERTDAIAEHRGIKEDDGLIRAEFWAEQERQEITETIIRRKYIDEYYPTPYYPPYDPWHPCPWRKPWSDGLTWGSEITCNTSGNFQKSASMGVSYNSSGTNSDTGIAGEQARGGFQGAMNMAVNNAGITVPGSQSNQQFHNALGFPLESNSTVIVLQLRGEVGGVAVEVPVTVDRKPECVTCGKVNKATNKFCSECGTALTII
jgi:hypothetical protein